MKRFKFSNDNTNVRNLKTLHTVVAWVIPFLLIGRDAMEKLGQREFHVLTDFTDCVPQQLLR